MGNSQSEYWSHNVRSAVGSVWSRVWVVLRGFVYLPPLDQGQILCRLTLSLPFLQNLLPHRRGIVREVGLPGSSHGPHVARSSAVFDPCITGRPNSTSAVARADVDERRPERSKLSESYSARHPGPPHSSTVTPQCSILAQALLGTIAEQAHGVREQSKFRPWTRHHGGRSLHRRSGSRRTG